MKAVLDTNFYTLCSSGSEAAIAMIADADEVLMPTIVYGELYYGFKNGKKLEQNIKQLKAFISDFQVDLISVRRKTAEHFGGIFAELRRAGRPIPTNDIWIAACCLEVDGVLLTLDKHFQFVPQLTIQSPE